MHRYQATALLATGAIALGLITASPGAAGAAGSVSIQQAAVVSNPVAQGSGFGYNVAVNARGTVMAVVSLNFDYNLGRVDIFSKAGAGWKHAATLTQPGVKTNPSHPGPNYGFSLALSAAGNELVVTSAGVDGNGAVYTYKQDGSAWKLSSTLTGTLSGGFFGAAATLTPDGSKLAVLTYAQSSQSVTTYHAATAGWVKDGTIKCPNGGCSAFPDGILAISSSGNTLAVQSFGAAADQAGVFTRKSGTWKLAASVPNQFPGSVTMNAAGNEVVVSSVETPVGGTANVFIRAYQQTSTGWKHTATLKAPCHHSGPNKGVACNTATTESDMSLNAAGTELAFGDQSAVVNGVVVGQAYLYGLTGGKFTAQAVVSGRTSVRGFGIGVALAANSSTMVVGESAAYDLRGEALVYSITQ